MIKLMKGDCMEEMKKLENESVDLILTDPPYGTIKGMEITKDGRVSNKRNDWDVVVNVGDMLEEFQRVLRPNGKALIFGNNGYTQELRNGSHTYMEYVYPLYWVKNSFGSPLSAKKAPLSYVEDITVFSKNFGEKKQQREYMKRVADYIKVDKNEIAERIGVGRGVVDRSWYTDAQFRIPTEANYNKLIEEFKIGEMEGFKTYEELKELVREESPSSVFNLPEGKGHVSNVFNVAKETSYLHPTQKPVELLKQLIEIYSDVDDVVLDAFMGSGSTGVACQNTGRKFIGIELDEEYFRLTEERLKENRARIEGARSRELEGRV